MNWFDITGWLDSLGHLNPAVILAIIGSLALLESAAFIGVLVPGETAVLLGGALAQQGHVNVVLMVLVVAIGATAGDSISYELGRFAGPRVNSPRLEAASRYFRRRGPSAVFFGRFVAVVRTAVPLLAGSSRMRYRSFLAWNVAGALLWSIVHVSLGYFAGASLPHLESLLHSFGYVAALAVAIAIMVLVARRTPSCADGEAAAAPRTATLA